MAVPVFWGHPVVSITEGIDLQMIIKEKLIMLTFAIILFDVRLIKKVMNNALEKLWWNSYEQLIVSSSSLSSGGKRMYIILVKLWNVQTSITLG